MKYVYEFVDELDCERCPHNKPADEESGWGDFDFVCLAREDGDEFVFPEGCPAYLGPWGAWRAVASDIAHDRGYFYEQWAALRAVGWPS